VKSNDRSDKSFEELRRKAESVLENRRGDASDISDLQELVHELQVHQIELQMQNEQLSQTRDELYKIKNNYQELFDHAPVGYFVLDLDTKVLEANYHGCAMLGKPIKTIKNIQFGMQFVHSSLVIFHDYIKQLISTRQPKDFEVQIRENRGLDSWVHLSCKLIGETCESQEQILVAMIDITDKKEREQQLAETKHEYSEIVESANSIIAKMDMEGRITFMNRYGLEFYGYTKEEIIGKSVIGTMAPKIDTEGKKVSYFLQEMLRNPGSFPEDISENLRADGSRAWVHWQNKPITDRNGKIVGILGIGQDITAQKKAQDIIKGDKKMLEALVEERTDQLLKAQEEIEASKRLRDLGRLAASVAHELRRPLASLKLALYNIRKKRTNREIDPHINNCDEKIFEGEQIINNLLKSSSLNKPEYKEIDFYAVLNECLIEIKKHYRARKARLEKKLEPLKEVTVSADPLQIKEAVYNILQNSYEALYSEQGKIIIEGFASDENAGFAVTDNDEGVPLDEIENMTEPFYTTKHRGMGLGLTITKEIIQGHGGSLEIESKEGVGTTVTVTLPKGRPEPGKSGQGG
jgi:PAS domain S-box-containing protein